MQPLSAFMDFITYEYMIENIMLLLKGALSGRDINELLEQCHPLGMFKDSTMRSILLSKIPQKDIPTYTQPSLLILLSVHTFQSSYKKALSIVELVPVMFLRKLKLKSSSLLLSNSGLKISITSVTLWVVILVKLCVIF